LKRIKTNLNLLFWTFLIIIIAACGLKGNPAPVSSAADYRQSVANIQASEDQGVILSWDFYDKKAAIKNIFVERSEIRTDGAECKDCPQDYVRIGESLLKTSLPGKEKISRYSFHDKKVTRGMTYNYRLLLCDKREICQEKYGAQISY